MKDESTDAQLADYGSTAPVNGEALPADAPKRKLGFTAMEIAEQVQAVQDWLAEGTRPNIIRQRCADRWGLATRTSEHRMAAARQQMIRDINIMDRAEKVSELIEKLETVVQQSIDRGMGANAIGAMRLQTELLQLTQRRT
jgi:hypothetical protein